MLKARVCYLIIIFLLFTSSYPAPGQAQEWSGIQELIGEVPRTVAKNPHIPRITFENWHKIQNEYLAKWIPLIENDSLGSLLAIDESVAEHVHLEENSIQIFRTKWEMLPSTEGIFVEPAIEMNPQNTSEWIYRLHWKDSEIFTKSWNDGGFVYANDSSGISFKFEKNWYVYLFEIDSSLAKNIVQLFPDQYFPLFFREPPNPIQRGEMYHIPSRSDLFKQNGQASRQFYFLVSPTPLKTVEKQYQTMISFHSEGNKYREQIVSADLLRTIQGSKGRLFKTHPFMHSHRRKQLAVDTSGIEPEIAQILEMMLPARPLRRNFLLEEE